MYSVITGGGSFSGGTYTAPSVVGTNTVKVTDVAGNIATATVTVNPNLTISPKSVSLITGEQISFGAAGGVPGYVYWSALGYINILTGVYNVPLNIDPIVDVVKVIDATGNEASASREYQGLSNFRYISVCRYADGLCTGDTLDSIGNIYVAGYAQESSHYHWIVRKYTPATSTWSLLDDLQYYSTGDSVANSVVTDSSGNIYVAGTANYANGLVRKYEVSTST